MRVLVWTIQHPTVEGIIFTPIILWWELMQVLFSLIPGRVGTFLWDMTDDVIIAITLEVKNAIRRTPNIWEYKFFK